MTLRVAVLQMTSRPGDVDANLSRLEMAVVSLADDVGLAVAPELQTTGYDLALISERGRDLAEPADGPSVERITALARTADMIVVSGFLEGDGDDLFDSAVIAGHGDPVVYRKTHLYPAERAVFAEGDHLVATDTAVGRLGAMICFEHAFPEIATSLAVDGVEIMVIPSAVPIGFEHLLSLRTRARAQDNQVFVLASNMSGAPSCGRSLIVDPRGTVLAEAGEAEEVILATLDLDMVTAEREREPALDLRRPDLYR